MLNNIKVFGCRANSDGFDICNSTDVTVDGCFLRTLDDLIVIKSDRGQGKVHHVVARNCVLWNQVAHALSIGAELREDVDDVLFTDCDVTFDHVRINGRPLGRQYLNQCIRAEDYGETMSLERAVTMNTYPRLFLLWSPVADYWLAGFLRC